MEKRTRYLIVLDVEHPDDAIAPSDMATWADDAFRYDADGDLDVTVYGNTLDFLADLVEHTGAFTKHAEDPPPDAVRMGLGVKNADVDKDGPRGSKP